MPALNEPYQHRACLACGKRIPRRTDGKATPALRVNCGSACGNHYRRTAKGRMTKGVAQNVKKRPINRAPFESVYVTEPRPEYPPCKARGRHYLRTSPAEQFCSIRCAEYVPLPPRKPDGEWFIVAGRRSRQDLRQGLSAADGSRSCVAYQKEGIKSGRTRRIAARAVLAPYQDATLSSTRLENVAPAV